MKSLNWEDLEVFVSEYIEEQLPPNLQHLSESESSNSSNVIEELQSLVQFVKVISNPRIEISSNLL